MPGNSYRNTNLFDWMASKKSSDDAIEALYQDLLVEGYEKKKSSEISHDEATTFNHHANLDKYTHDLQRMQYFIGKEALDKMTPSEAYAQYQLFK